MINQHLLDGKKVVIMTNCAVRMAGIRQPYKPLEFSAKGMVGQVIWTDKHETCPSIVIRANNGNIYLTYFCGKEII